MILVDSSVWVDFLRGTPSPEAGLLARLIERRSLDIVVGDVILCEVLQGVPSERLAREVEGALRAFRVAPIVGEAVAVAAAANFRALRARGVTVRKTIDLLIGTFCLQHGHALLHRDRDFDPMEAHLGLDVVRA